MSLRHSRPIRLAATGAALLSVLQPGPGATQSTSTSAGPASVAVTIYRAPGRGAAEAMQLQWLNGYALISETRQVSIPAGEADIRFEGVAGGILPESAIVTGLPEGVVEKNQDAFLLSPASLIERSLGRRVHLRRTSLASGEVREQDAVIRSGAEGAVVLQTAEGYEALRCTGIPETIVYDRIPEGLSPRPTLSVRTRSSSAATATVTLSYLASGFDWQANYVATLSPDEQRVDLFAWVTLASGDETSFVNADTQTVAGRPNRVDQAPAQRPSALPLNLQCWPSQTTSDIEQREELRQFDLMAAPPPPAPPPPAPVSAIAESIVVTGARMARQEELGDLKLYRLPDRVTVASNSQKQVAMLTKKNVAVAVVYRQRIVAEAPDSRSQVMRVITTRNRTREGLGLPLPQGKVVLFGAGRERPILLGEGSIEDNAVGEDVEIEIAEAMGVEAQVSKVAEANGRSTFELRISNDRDRAVQYEAELEEGGARIDAGRIRLGRRDGRPLWTVTVPANGSAVLRYTLIPELISRPAAPVADFRDPAPRR